MSAELDVLKQQTVDLKINVQNNATVITAAIAEIQKMAANIADLTIKLNDAIAANDPAAIQAAADDIAAENVAINNQTTALNVAIAPAPAV